MVKKERRSVSNGIFIIIFASFDAVNPLGKIT
jgi:hypothetical protein